MALPNNKDEAISYCLRKLGAPVIEINVANEQIEDRVLQALQYFHEFHFDSTIDTLRAYEVKRRPKYSSEIGSKTIKTKAKQEEYYIELEDFIWGVRNITPIHSNAYADNFLFDFNYYMTADAINTTQNMNSGMGSGIRDGLASYHQAKEYLSLINYELGSKVNWTFSKFTNEILIHTQARYQFALVECTKIISPEEFGRVWSNAWLLSYLEALIQEQWGNNLIKFKNATLPGNVTIDADAILRDAKDKILKLEEQLDADSPPLPIIIA